jgi:hypothetical protein
MTALIGRKWPPEHHRYRPIRERLLLRKERTRLCTGRVPSNDAASTARRPREFRLVDGLRVVGVFVLETVGR